MTEKAESSKVNFDPFKSFAKWMLYVLIVAVVLGGPGYYFLCLNHTGVNQLGVAFNSINGQIQLQEQPGWYRTSPFVKVAYIDLLPQSVHIPSGAKVINTKVVRFRPEGLNQYIELHGFGYVIGQNLNNNLLGYAFCNHPEEFKFLEVCQEGGQENLTNVRSKPVVRP